MVEGFQFDSELHRYEQLNTKLLHTHGDRSLVTCRLRVSIVLPSGYPNLVVGSASGVPRTAERHISLEGITLKLTLYP